MTRLSQDLSEFHLVSSCVRVSLSLPLQLDLLLCSAVEAALLPSQSRAKWPDPDFYQIPRT